ncbi:MAG: hypothetical protein IKC64_03595 [Clostridia bacterium]|nr:hypothetical protein [Clostridia bacterium]
MKKFFALMLSVISVFCFVGCTPEQVGVDPVSPAPWVYDGNPANAYEKSTYKIVKTDQVTNTVIAEGELTFTIAPVTGETDGIELSTFSTNFSLTFNNDAPEVDRGKTDTIVSSVTFSSISLSPRYSEKTVTLADREGVQNQSYTLVNDYVDGVSTLQMDGLNFNSTINFAGKSMLNVYDSNSIYTYLRAYPGMGNSKSGRFKINSFFDMHFNGARYAPLSMVFAGNGSSNDITANIGATLGEKYLGDDSGNVTAFKLDLTIDSEQSGPPRYFYLSKSPFVIEKATTPDGKDKSTSLVIVKMVEQEFDYNLATVRYLTEYTLTDYTTVNA